MTMGLSIDRMATPPMARTFVFCNGVFFLYALHWLLPFPAVLLAFLVNVMIFIAPGAAWLSALKGIGKDPVMGTIFTIVLSFLMWCAVLLAGAMLGFPKGSGIYLLIIWGMTNLGIALFRGRDDGAVFFADVFVSSAARRLVALLVGVFGIVYAAAAIYPPGLDHDYEVPGAAPGMVKEFTPHFAYNSPNTTLYFAHPPGAIIHMGLGALFLDELDQLEYYVTSGKGARVIIESDPGDVHAVAYAESNGWEGRTEISVRNIDDELFELTESNDKGNLTAWDAYVWYYPENVMERSDTSVTYELSRYAVTRYFFVHDLERFKKGDFLFLMRIGNLLVTALIVVLIFQFAVQCGLSERVSLLISLTYLFSLGIFVRSAMAGHVALSELGILILLYQAYAMRNAPVFEWIKKPYWLAPGLYAAWADQKTVLVPLALGAYAGLAFLFQARSWSGFWASVQRGGFTAVTLGWGLGLGLFILYGFILAPWQFYNFFILEHGAGRLDLTPDSYVTPLADLYRDILIEAPIIFVSLGALAAIAFSGKLNVVLERGGVAIMAVAVGLIGFSAIDWRYSKQFMTIVPAAVMLLPILLASLGEIQRRLVIAAMAICAVAGAVLCVAIAFDFSLFKPTNNFW